MYKDIDVWVSGQFLKRQLVRYGLFETESAINSHRFGDRLNEKMMEKFVLKDEQTH